MDSLDPEVVARVLRRASELDRTERVLNGDPEVDLWHRVSVDNLVSAAEEVGLSASAMQRSIAIERLGPKLPEQRGDGLVGGAIISVDDEMPGSPPEILQRLDAWLVDGHHLRRERRRDEPSAVSGEWAKRDGVVGMTVRTVRHATGEGRLGDLRSITATASSTGMGGCAVRVTADRSLDRKQSIVAGAAFGAVAVGGLIAGAIALSPLLLVASPVAAAAGLHVAARGKRSADRTRREIERLLETVGQGTDPTRLRVDVARRVVGRTRH